MKLGLIEKIITEYRASKKETILIWVIMLAVSVSIGLSCIMLNSQQIERSLMKNIDIKLEADGGHIFDCKYSGELPTRKRLLSDARGPQLFCSFYRELVEFGKHEGIVDYGYSLGTDQAVLTKNNEELSNTNTMYRMLGISSPNYQTNEQIELIEGRFLTEDEIRNRAYKIVVDEAITINGEKIKVGDRLTVSIIGYTVYYTNLPSVYKYYSKEIEVLGIYRYKTAFDMSFGKKDAFLNNHCILIPEGVMEEAILDQELLDYNAVFMVGAEGNAGSIGAKKENPSELKVSQNDYGVTMRSVDKTSNFYFIIFAVGTVTSVVLMAVMMTFILNKKIREINIYYSLGEDKRGVIRRYAGYYCAVGLTASVIGYVMAYGLSQILFAQLVRSSANVQAELVQLANIKNGMVVNELELLGMKGSELLLSATLSIAGVIVIVFLTVCMSLMYILHGQIRDKINGGF